VVGGGGSQQSVIRDRSSVSPEALGQRRPAAGAGSPVADSATRVTPEDALAVLLVGTANRRQAARARIAELSARVDDEQLTATLRRQRILLLAGTRLLDLVAADVLVGFRAGLDEALRAARLRAMAFATATGHVVAGLEQAGIPAVSLKGAAMSAELYDDEAVRVYDDIDILVPAGQLARATEVAESLGWRIRPSAAAVTAALPRLHTALQHPRGAPELELHWRIHWYETAFSALLIENSRVIDGLRRLDPFDEFAALLLFYARDGFAGLRLAADIGAWWDRHGASDTTVALERRLREHPSLAEPWRAALAAAAAVGVLPSSVLTPGLRCRRRRAALACRLANWDLHGDQDQIMANVTLVDGLLAPPGGLRAFVGRRLDAAASAARARDGGIAALRAPRVGFEVAKTLVRYVIALWHLRGGRRWSPAPEGLDGSARKRTVAPPR
jgi:putative nucleotidyltransferase-like protein